MNPGPSKYEWERARVGPSFSWGKGGISGTREKLIGAVCSNTKRERRSRGRV